MKKLLLMAAIAATGFAAAPVAQAEFVPEANTPYLLKLNGTETYLQVVTPGTGGNGTNGNQLATAVSSPLTPIYFIAGSDDNAGKYAIQSVETGKYLGASQWNSVINFDEPLYWTVTETEDGLLTFGQNVYYGSNNQSRNLLGTQSDSRVFVDNYTGDEANRNVYWTLETFESPLYNVTINWKTSDGTVFYTVNKLLDGSQYAENSTISAPSEVATGTLTVADGATADFVLKENCVPFKLVSARYRTRWAISNGTGITTTVGDDASVGNWFVEQPGEGTSKFFSINDEKYFGAIVDSGNPTALVDDAAQANSFRIVRHESGAEYIYNADNNVAFNQRNNNVAGWSAVDIGSRYFMVYDSEAYEANKASYYGDSTGDLGNEHVSPFQASVLAASNLIAAIESMNIEDEEVAAAKTTLENAVAEANAARFGKKGVNVPALIKTLDDAVAAVPVKLLASIKYESLTGVSTSFGGNVSIPGYVSASNELVAALYNAISTGTDEEVSAAVAAIEASTPSYSYDTTDGAIYTIHSTDLDVRGYLRHSDGLMANTVAPTASTFDAENPDFHFVFVTIDGVKYLYNIGAGKFMNAFGEKTDNTWPAIQNGADYSWRFSEVPTQIRSLILFTSNIAHSFTVSAGLTPSNNDNFASGQVHEGGLSMTNSGTRPNIVTMGITGRGDGNGLLADFVGMMSAEDLAAVVAKATEALNGVTAQVNAIPEITEESHVVNHLTAAAAADVKAATAHDHRHYLLESGERQAPVAGTAYTLVNEEGEAWTVNTSGEIVLAPVADKTADNEAFYQWILAVNEPAVTEPEETEEPEVAALADSAAPTYTFNHTHDGKVIALSIEGATEHELGTATLGKVTLGGNDYVMASTNGDATTTEITEVSGVEAESEVYYDLSGRRVAAPSKGGIYVTAGGKKVIF